MGSSKDVMWDDAGQVEDLFMNAADGETASVAVLASALEGEVPRLFGNWPDEVKEAWASGLELMLESCPVSGNEAAAALLRRLAAVGYDTPAFRDALAAVVRFQFEEYADPAGLIQAFGILDQQTSTREIHKRWQVFTVLQEGVECVQPAQGVGVIEDIDQLSSEVRIRFERPQRMPLDLAVQTLHVVRPESTLATWRSKAQSVDTAQLTQAEIRERGNDLIPATTDMKIVRDALVPAVLTESLFRKIAAGKAKTVQKQQDDAVQRSIAEARSAEELREVIRQTDTVKFSDADRANVQAILKPLAERPQQMELFRDLVAENWLLLDGADWFRAFLADCAPSAVCWKNDEEFALLTDGLTGKNRLDAWLEATAAATGIERFCELGVQLPQRRWGGFERVVGTDPRGPADLLECVVARAKSGDATADMILWLWKNRADTDVMRDPTVVLRTLAKPVKGAYLKAHRDLRRLMLSGEAYHQFLLEDAGQEEMESVVRTIDHSVVLDHGERQTVLVRLARLFPDLRAVIEHAKGAKKSAPRIRKQGPVTSHRSYQRAWRQLRDIIEVKIPENSRAIAHARSYGDLRENAEYKAAKEEQGLLARKRSDLERSLDRVKPLDFSVVEDFSRVMPGCTVEVTDETGTERTFHVLGLWDSDPEHQMISYDTPLGKALQGRNVGDTVEGPTGQLKITDIRPLEDDMLQWLKGEEEEE